MRAAFYTKQGKFDVRDVRVAEPGPGEVAVRVAYCGICGTDLHIFHGKMDARVSPPQVIGHEMSGVVESAGPGVTDWKSGDRVTVRPLDWCGECAACKAGHSHVCMKLKFMGIDSPGAFQEIWNVKERTLHRVPEKLSLRTAALIEPLAVACHDVKTAEIKPGDFAVVLGGGPIGLLIAMTAQASGAKVLMSEPGEFRLDFAQKAGFDTVNPLKEDLTAAVMSATNGVGADVVFEVSASEAAAKSMTELARVRGKLVTVGIYSKPPPVDLFKFFWRELRLFGARLYEPDDFDHALSLAASGKLPLESLITDVFDIDKIQKGFESPGGNPKEIKTLVRLSAGSNLE
jgi:2-desacetyl-2-hydroxyethyl bacteriochlorophyllide A dehydrogenase